MKYLLVTLVIVLTFHAIKAETVQWVGGDGDWNVPANWDCACIPDTLQAVWIADGTVTIPAGIQVYVESIRITSTGALMNYDTVFVNSPISYGIRIDGQFENIGKVVILATTGKGIQVNGDFINYGNLLIDSIPGNGIEMQDDSASLENYGLIDIVCFDGAFGIFSSNPATSLYNAPGGEISVSRGLSNSSNIEFYGVLHNRGIIDLYDGDFGGLGTLINEGYFSMVNPIDHAQQGCQMKNIFNMEEGVFILKNISSYGFIFNDTIVNYGLIDIKNTFADAFSLGSGYMVNYGEIKIDSIRRYGILTGTNSVLRNEENATIHVSRSIAGGIRVQQIEFYNNGLITLDSVGSNLSTDADFGIQCVTGGSMFNDSLGIIKVDSCYAAGISLGTSLTSVNHGIIKVRRARTNGMTITTNHTLYNSGLIDIDSISSHGINITGTSTTFYNAGHIEIGAEMDLTDFSIYNASTFINDTCGYVTTVNKLRNSNTFTNYGFLKNRSANAHTFTSGGNTINMGVIEDYTGFIAGNSNFDNDGIVLNQQISSGCPMDSLMEVLTLGTDSNFVVTGIYADHPGHSPVASYDNLTNVAVQSDIFPVTADWLWVFQNIYTGCEDTMRMKILVSCPVICATGDTNYWTGCMETSDWADGDNWSAGVPLPTNDVIIPYLGIRPDPVLMVTSLIHSLELRSGATFGVHTGSLLTIE